MSNFGADDLGEALKAGSTKPVVDQLAYNLLFRAIEHEIQSFCVENDVAILTYSSIMQGLLAGTFSRPQDVPDDRARTRHFSNSRSQARHGESGCEEDTFQTIAAIRAIAEEAGIPMADLAIAWLTKRTGVASVIVGARNAEQVERNLKAADVSLSDELIDRLDDATLSLKETLGTNADLWQGDSRVR